MAAETTKILLLSANPNDTNQLRLNEEFREIREGLSASGNNRLFEVRQGGATRTKDLRRLILSYQPHIIHFSGHASAEGIFLETDAGHYTAVTGQALANLFSLFSDTVNCVILNSCYSSAQATEIVKQIPYVIGMNAVIKDDTAIQFSMGFYDALGAGRNIEDAYKFGCNAIQLEDDHYIEQANRGVVFSTNSKKKIKEATQDNDNDESHKPILLIKAKKTTIDVIPSETEVEIDNEIIPPIKTTIKQPEKRAPVKTARHKRKSSWMLVGLLSVVLAGVALLYYKDDQQNKNARQPPARYLNTDPQRDIQHKKDPREIPPPRRDQQDLQYKKDPREIPPPRRDLGDHEQ